MNRTINRQRNVRFHTQTEAEYHIKFMPLGLQRLQQQINAKLTKLNALRALKNRSDDTTPDNFDRICKLLESFDCDDAAADGQRKHAQTVGRRNRRIADERQKIAAEIHNQEIMLTELGQQMDDLDQADEELSLISIASGQVNLWTEHACWENV